MTESPTLFISLAVVAGIAIGLVAGYLTFPAIREAKRLREQLDTTLREHEDYRSSVDSHFRKTGELIGEMTRSYAAVYDHLATGARTFASGPAAETALPFGASPRVLVSPVVETTGSDASPSDGAAVAGVAEDSGPAEPTDAAIDGSMLASEVFVGSEANVDSASTTSSTTPAETAADLKA